ncbi:uncharacterized protein EV420DRAFT_1517377 [Desarmillaria tabescens]|uniref:Uncharacterized protein n=1 Tax=Armillaria tabescens TaxID=1929756 RepID=A0AA39NFF6_ARMTA|nr:uncharacterized protein EV420DRAFT_1517377 [Desarmillaria tabescens]KAK0464646.1 hypothetical protein EV420DRAFT_1517377 [Desarmillaria tabescens]
MASVDIRDLALTLTTYYQGLSIRSSNSEWRSSTLIQVVRKGKLNKFRLLVEARFIEASLICIDDWDTIKDNLGTPSQMPTPLPLPKYIYFTSKTSIVCFVILIFGTIIMGYVVSSINHRVSWILSITGLAHFTIDALTRLITAQVIGEYILWRIHNHAQPTPQDTLRGESMAAATIYRGIGRFWRVAAVHWDYEMLNGPVFYSLNLPMPMPCLT